MEVTRTLATDILVAMSDDWKKIGNEYCNNKIAKLNAILSVEDLDIKQLSKHRYVIRGTQTQIDKLEKEIGTC